MHLICLGVVKRISNYFRKGPMAMLSQAHILQIFEKLIEFRNYIPSDFARRPRSLLEVDGWKTIEFRKYLLYTVTVSLKGLFLNLSMNTVFHCQFQYLFWCIKMATCVKAFYLTVKNY